MCHSTDSEIRKILYLDAVDAFLVFDRSGLFHIIDIETWEVSFVSSPPSDSGHYLIEASGHYVCVAAHDVLCRPAFSNAYVETILSLYRVHRWRDSIRAEAIDVQHVDNRQPRILSMAFHRGANSLYLYRQSTLERWQLDQPSQHNITRIAVSSDRSLALPFCAAANGGFYVDETNQLKFLPMTPGQKPAELASFRIITFLSSMTGQVGYMVEDNRALYRFALEEE
jgi:hypothetical protein